VAPTFGTASIVLLIDRAAVGRLRLIAEERRNQTLPFLMSSPVSNFTRSLLGKVLRAARLPVAGGWPLLVLMAVSLLLSAASSMLGLLAGNVASDCCSCCGRASRPLELYLFSCLTAHPLVAGNRHVRRAAWDCGW